MFMYFILKNQQKTTKSKLPKSNNDVAVEVSNQNIRLMQESYTNQLKQMREELTSTQRSLSRYKALLKKYQEENEIGMMSEQSDDNDDINDLQRNYEIDPQKAIQYTQKLGLNPQALSNPALTNILWQKLNENKDMALMLGIIRPKGMAQPITSTPDTTGGYANILSELQAQGRFA